MGTETTGRTEAEDNRPERTGGLTRSMWRDDNDPVARTARSYERAIRSINKAQVPPPWYKRVGAYIAGGLAGAIPGGIIYAFAPKTKTMEIVTHITATAGIVAGVDIADSLMEIPHMNKQSQENADFLDEARNTARASYAQSVAAQKEAPSQTPQRG